MKSNMKNKIETLWYNIVNDKCENPSWIYDDHDISHAYEDYKVHNGKLKECKKDTQNIYILILEIIYVKKKRKKKNNQ